MSGSGIKALLFDLGNVLVNFDHRIAVNKLSPLSGKSPDEIYSLFFDSELIQLFEEGKISPEDFFIQVTQALGISMPFARFLPIWNNIFFQTAENRLVYSLVRTLRAKYRVGLISNINPLHFEFLRQTTPIFDAFDFLVTSYAVGAVKPKPRIYQAALEAAGARAQESFYVDDRIELIHAARTLGMRAYVYKGFAQLALDLAECGIA
ncbi:MAG: HAD family phosphatase [Candidatus Omnitrophica bacterium]|nr:HAD family phosphatase [Candidatus Omnitrophota bacterium]